MLTWGSNPSDLDSHLLTHVNADSPKSALTQDGALNRNSDLAKFAPQHDQLRATVSMALAQLTKYQAADGYLGPFPDAKGPDGLRTMKAGWDSWGHYHICLGCLLWYEATSDPVPLAIATKISQLMITTFPGSCNAAR